MVRTWSSVVYQMFEWSFRISAYLWHQILEIANMCVSGQSVPGVDDPLLLKSATVLSREIREGTLKSEDVVSAYIRRIEVVEPYINAVAERRFQKALEEARAVDSLLASGKWTKEQLAEEKPLLGVPITIKALITVKGMPSTAGSVQFKNVVAGEDGDCVALVKNAGAIVLATTNTAEIGCSIETNNNVYGKTCNPYDTRRTCGGSSGGEGALNGAAGSAVGIGNDIGGSIRLPSMYNGIFGHKPSKGVVPNEGCFPKFTTKSMEFLGTGPMCRYAEDLATIMKVLTAQNKTPLKFGAQVNFKKLNICYMTSIRNDSWIVDVSNENTEALMKVVSYFETQYGIKPIRANIPLLRYGNKVTMTVMSSTDRNVKNTLTAGKGCVNGYKEFFKYIFGKSDFTFFVVMAFLAAELKLKPGNQKRSFYTGVRQDLQRHFENLLDDDTILLIPTFPLSASYHNELVFLAPSCIYMAIFNLLGLPATHCPLGLNSRGLPLGIQVVSKRGNDPLNIAVALELEKAFGGWVQPQKGH